jgi:hypothetical protein
MSIGSGKKWNSSTSGAEKFPRCAVLTVQGFRKRTFLSHHCCSGPVSLAQRSRTACSACVFLPARGSRGACLGVLKNAAALLSLRCLPTTVRRHLSNGITATCGGCNAPLR